MSEGDITNKNVGKLLKEIRGSKNLTQEEVGTALKLGRDAIIKIEKGTRKITADELKLFEELYNVEVEDLLNNNIDNHN